MAYISFQPQDYFNTKLWTGTGAENAITGVGFQPDWVWIKNRDAAEHNKLYDAVRGANKVIFSNLTNPELTVTQDVKSFDADGFTLGTETALNASGQDIVGWSWKANGQGSSNTDGTINTTYTSANTTSGFSIVKYTGTGIVNSTVGHGLGAKVDFLMIKDLGNSSNWIVGHKDTFTTGEIYLNLTNALAAAFGPFNKTAPTTSVFNLGTDVICNGSGRNYVAYCFAEKKGFSKFGSYTGNGNADGPFIYTGFKPAMVIYKRSDGIEAWMIQDNRRPGYNPMGGNLFPSATNAESTDARFDFLSNGFKARSGNQNTSSSTHIYMAFAEEPLVSSNGVPAVAR